MRFLLANMKHGTSICRNSRAIMTVRSTEQIGVDRLPGLSHGADMSVWESESVLDAVLEALGGVHLNNPQGHHFGRPYLTAYQLAVKVDSAHPAIGSHLGVAVGGRGTAERKSLAQYLARELSRRIRKAAETDTYFAVEGAFVSNEHLKALTYTRADGTDLISSLTGTGFDLSLFRLAAPPAPNAAPQS